MGHFDLPRVPRAHLVGGHDAKRRVRHEGPWCATPGISASRHRKGAGAYRGSACRGRFVVPGPDVHLVKTAGPCRPERFMGQGPTDQSVVGHRCSACSTARSAKTRRPPVRLRPDRALDVFPRRVGRCVAHVLRRNRHRSAHRLVRGHARRLSRHGRPRARDLGRAADARCRHRGSRIPAPG